MNSDIIVIGAGAAGLMAALSAAKTLSGNYRDGDPARTVTLLEKMPRPARKMMISGKGRCNFSNLKSWEDFSSHVRSGNSLLKNAYYGLTPEKTISLLASYGLESVVERGDRVFPESHRACDVVDTLVLACKGAGVRIVTEAEVTSLETLHSGFALTISDGSAWNCSKLIIATGGLSYPSTGSTGDGLRWAEQTEHKISRTFPSLTALVPDGYKTVSDEKSNLPEYRFHIDRSLPLTQLGKSLCGISLKNVGLTLLVEGKTAQSEFGDLDFTDGGIEGAIGFAVSRKAVKSMLGGSRVSVVVDLKSGVDLTQLTLRVKQLWEEIDKDPRSKGLHEKQKCRILLGKLMPWDLIPAFIACNPSVMTLERRSRTSSKVWVNLPSIAKALKEWKFDIRGYVGYERCVVTAGGVDCGEVISKTLESRRVSGMYFCGEVLDVDADTGGYNLQSAFSTGALAGRSAAIALITK